MRTEFNKAYVTTRDDIAILTLDHPESLNAMSIELIIGVGEALQYIERNAHFRAAILTGEGKAFSSGVNLSGTGGASSSFGSALETHFHPLLRRMRQFKMPLVCAVNGPAAGIGMSLALSGDLTIAARSAYFLQAFARIGLVPDGGSSWLLPRLVGLARAKELSLLAEKLPAEKALEWGLINRVSDDATLMRDAIELAEKLAKGPMSLALIRNLYTESLRNSYEDQLDLEQRLQMQALKSEDFVEGLMAFHEKRAPHFKGR